MRLVSAKSPEGVVGVLRDGLAASGKTQLQLAQHLGFSAKHTSFMLTGRAQISIPNLLTALEFLDLALVLSSDLIVQTPLDNCQE